MNFRTLIRRNLRYHWRSHLGVVLGAAVGSAALIGALVVGDSVKGSLRERALARLGNARFTLQAQGRYFTVGLADKMQDTIAAQKAATAAYSDAPLPLLIFSGSAVTSDSGARANKVQVIGTPFKSNTTRKQRLAGATQGELWVNKHFAGLLRVKIGDEIILRIQKPTALSAEAAVSSRGHSTTTLRFELAGIVGDDRFADFELKSGNSPPINAFVSLSDLQQATGLRDRANTVLIRRSGFISLTEVGQLTQKWPGFIWQHFPSLLIKAEDNNEGGFVGNLQDALTSAYALSDLELDLIKQNQVLVLKTPRVFLDESISHASLTADTNAQPILTYLATLLRAGTNAAPYSMVTAAGAPWTPVDLRDDEIVVGQWLAEDLKVKPGDEIALSYFLPESGAKLEEATNKFRVHSIVPMEMPWADRTLMPDFPGIEKAESTSEWDAGFPLTYKVRTKDDEYWKQHRGTPKAFITLAAGQKMWGNRFGNLTAIRFPIPTGSSGRESAPSEAGEGQSRLTSAATSDEFRASLEKKILANLKPEELGLRFEPVREQALKAAEGSQDFGGLFLGFSFFIIGAALLLMAMLFQFGLEQRASEIGTLLALGFTPAQVRKLFLREGVVLAFIGGVIGAIGGIYYAKAMLHGLNTAWSAAVGGAALNFHITGQTLVVGVFAGVVVSTITIWFVLRKFVKRSPRELLIGEIGSDEFQVSSFKFQVVAGVTAFAAAALCGWAVVSGDTSNAGVFFSAGVLVLIAGIAFASAKLSRLSVGDSITVVSLAVRSCARRRKRSLATVAMLACGSFLIVSIGVFRLDASRDATQKSSGTGGFALMGETTMPVVHDLNSQSGRDFFALNAEDLQGLKVVPFRVRAGDEASCLNLNAAQKPKLIGVKPEMLEGRFRFARGAGWQTLKSEIEIPAIGDANSIQWAMKKKVGDTIDYVDERGQSFKVRIVGAVANSILQGQLIIDEAEFVKRFPGESGYRMFLMDAPSNAVSQVSATLSRAMQDVGLELTPTAVRLNQFNAVQNTYLGTFQVLGGLGLLLGSVGLGIVVLRNVLERRGELALLMAVGFRKRQVQRLLLIENCTLLLAGLALGIMAAAEAVLPALLAANSGLPVMSLTLTLAAVMLNGALWTWAATRFAVRGDLLKALRNE